MYFDQKEKIQSTFTQPCDIKYMFLCVLLAEEPFVVCLRVKKGSYLLPGGPLFANINQNRRCPIIKCRLKIPTAEKMFLRRCKINYVISLSSIN